MKELAPVTRTPERITPAVFQPMTNETIVGLKQSVQDRLGIDISGIPVVCTAPGEDRFDFLQSQHKLIERAGSREAYEQMLLNHGYSLRALPRGRGGEILRSIALAEGLDVDDSLPAFAYKTNAGITFAAIREDRIVEMAQKYARKEKVGKRIESSEEAREFLEHLCRKYFYHEVGHVLFDFIPDEWKRQWRELVLHNQNLLAEIRNIQAENHPVLSDDILVEEAFADAFVPVASGQYTNRLGYYPELESKIRELFAGVAD